ncbi:MAG: GNAT family N-acetyltransferase, partial [Deltaproteobacteria bacterium]|nr:GNAT family N-acetyltransferase [Deltaproteobacteria bacterium]
CKNWAGPKVRFPLSIENLSKDIEFSDNNSYCLIQSEAIIAFGQLLTKEKGYLHLARIIVDPSKRAMSYGKLLCNDLLQIALLKGYHKISLNVYRNNTSALKLYKNLGFREIAEKSSKENCHMIMS